MSIYIRTEPDNLANIRARPGIGIVDIRTEPNNLQTIIYKLMELLQYTVNKIILIFFFYYIVIIPRVGKISLIVSLSYNTKYYKLLFKLMKKIYVFFILIFNKLRLRMKDNDKFYVYIIKLFKFNRLTETLLTSRFYIL